MIPGENALVPGKSIENVRLLGRCCPGVGHPVLRVACV